MPLLDAAHYIKHVWDAISHTTISNAFMKAGIKMTLPSIENEAEDINLISNFMPDLRSLHIPMEADDLDRFVHADDKNNIECTEVLSQDVDGLLCTMSLDEVTEDAQNADGFSATQMDEE